MLLQTCGCIPCAYLGTAWIISSIMYGASSIRVNGIADLRRCFTRSWIASLRKCITGTVWL